MTKRITAAVLWFYTGWYVGGFIALCIGVPAMIGPILGVSAAVLFAGDPFGLIWKSKAETASSSQALGTPTPALDL